MPWSGQRSSPWASKALIADSTARLVAVVPGERQQGRVEADGLPLALQHSTFQIVVGQHPRHAADKTSMWRLGAVVVV